MLSLALQSGFQSAGIDTIEVGVMPSGGISYLTAESGATMGAIVSASHNPAADNGIKFFGPDGFKLSDDAEAEIERIVAGDITPAQPGNIGRAKRIEDGRGRYVEYAKTTFPAGKRLDGLRVVIDCANGAASGHAAALLRRLGTEVEVLHDRPDGRNINDEIGRAHV